jgi:hypothetical protein
MPRFRRFADSFPSKAAVRVTLLAAFEVGGRDDNEEDQLEKG